MKRSTNRIIAGVAGTAVLAIAGAGCLAEFGMIGARMPLLTVAVAVLMRRQESAS